MECAISAGPLDPLVRFSVFVVKPPLS